MKKPINVGIIGYGSCGRLHAEVIQKLSSIFFLVAIADIDSVAAPEGARIYSDYRELLADPGVDAISICTYPNLHYEQTLAALNSEIYRDVLVEKPPVLEVGQCRELGNLALTRGVVLYFAHHTSMIPPVAAARQLLAGREVVGIEALYMDNALGWHSPDKWIFKVSTAGGGVLMDCGINIMSAVMGVLPEARFTPTRVKVSSAPSVDVETQAEVDFSFGTRGSGHLTMDWEYPKNIRRIRFTTSDGETVTIDIVRGRLYCDGRVAFGFENSDNNLSMEYPLVYQDFADHIARRESNTNTQPLRFILDTYNKIKDR